jgi:hypothetical protein
MESKNIELIEAERRMMVDKGWERRQAMGRC